MPAAFQIHGGVQEQTARHDNADQQKNKFLGREFGEVTEVADLVPNIFNDKRFGGIQVFERNFKIMFLRVGDDFWNRFVGNFREAFECGFHENREAIKCDGHDKEKQDQRERFAAAEM